MDIISETFFFTTLIGEVFCPSSLLSGVYDNKSGGIWYSINNFIKSCVNLLKPGAPLLLYLYYAFDNRPLWFRILWKFSDLFRKIISKFPSRLKHFITDLIALVIYLPLARLSFVLEKLKVNISNIPLSFYRNHSFYTMRTDARDRFGTPLEKRFTKEEILRMMKSAGLKNIIFSSEIPYWCALGYKLNS